MLALLLASLALLVQCRDGLDQSGQASQIATRVVEATAVIETPKPKKTTGPATSTPVAHPTPTATQVAVAYSRRAESVRSISLGDIEAITALNAADARARIGTYRTMPITAGSTGGTRTLRGANGFVITFPLRGGTQITPAVYGGLLLSGGPSSSRSLHAFDAHDGTPVWSLDLGDNGPSALACDEGVCAFNTESCSLYVVDMKTGTPLWGKWLADPLMSAPAISGGRVFSAYPDWHADGPSAARGSLVAFDLRSGEPLWRRRLDDDVISAPVALRDEVLLTTVSGTVYRFAQRTGKPTSARLGPAPVHSDIGHEGTPTADGAAYLVIRPMPKLRDSRALKLFDRTVVRRDRDVLATGAAGARLWTSSVGATTAPIAAAGLVWVGTNQGTVVGLDRETGEVIRTFVIGSTVRAEPVIEGGWIYAATDDGLVAVDTKDPSLTGWSQWGGNAQRASVEKAPIPRDLRAGP